MKEKVLHLKSGTIGGLARQGQIEVVTVPVQKEAAGGDLAEARQLFGEHFLGPEAVEKAFGVRIAAKDIPAIPFTRSELERAKELGQRLVLRVDKAPDGSPLTMAKMEEVLLDKFRNAGEGIIFNNKDGYETEGFFAQDTPRPGWALISAGVIPGSASKNYLQQIETLITYLQKEVFKGGGMPQQYQEAVAEFRKQKRGIAGILSASPQEAAKRLSQLKIDQLTRHTPAEIVYDILLNFRNTGERQLLDVYTWTSGWVSDGLPVSIGLFNQRGLGVGTSSFPDGYNDSLAVFFSRRS